MVDDIDKTLKTAEGIFKAVPVYQDAIQPAAQEVGKGLLVVAQTVNVALSPLKAIVWGYKQIEEYLQTELVQKLSKIPESRIVSPNLNVAGPIVEALKFTGHDETLRELFTNLLATAMDSERINQAHPAFASIIQQLTSDEAKILKQFTRSTVYPLVTIYEKVLRNRLIRNYSLLGDIAKCTNPDLVSSYLDNLIRLGLMEIRDSYDRKDEFYDRIKSSSKIKEIIERHSEEGVEFLYKEITLTNFGIQFCRACVIDNDGEAITTMDLDVILRTYKNPKLLF